MEHTHTNRNKKFFKDFGIYSIGILGTRIVMFLMVPFYTYFIEDTGQFGYYDLCSQICLFLIPLTTLQMREASFRFLLETDNNDSRTQVVSFIYRTLFFNILIISLLVALAAILTNIPYLWHTFALLIALTLHEVVCQISRGLKRNDVYVSCNIVNALLIGVLSVLFVGVMDMGIEGIFYANLASRIAVIALIEIRLHVFTQYFKFSAVSKEVGKSILAYSLPLILTNMCWLFTTSSDRFFIVCLIDNGTAVNGVYSVAVKFTMILQTLAVIFYQTWQETAITQYHTSDRDEFFSKIFNIYVYVLVALLIVYSFTLKLNYGWLVGENYQNSVIYLFPLGISFLLSSLSSAFFDLGYQCAKETRRSIIAVVLTVILNVTLNLLITPKIGIWGVISANVVSYLFLALYRYFDTRRYFRISIDHSSFALPVVLLLGLAAYHYSDTVMEELAAFAVLVMIMIALAPSPIKQMLKKLHK